jgi:hypothetical protein
MAGGVGWNRRLAGRGESAENWVPRLNVNCVDSDADRMRFLVVTFCVIRANVEGRISVGRRPIDKVVEGSGEAVRLSLGKIGSRGTCKLQGGVLLLSGVVGRNILDLVGSCCLPP